MKKPMEQKLTPEEEYLMSLKMRPNAHYYKKTIRDLEKRLEKMKTERRNK